MDLDSYLQAAMNVQHKVMKMDPSFPPIRGPEKGEIKYWEINPAVMAKRKS